MDITPPKSDKGIQRLKETNRSSALRQPDLISPYPPIESSETHHETAVKPHVERRMQQRRKEERRQQESDRPFDTRSEVERRKHDRRSDNQPETNPEQISHIDEKV
jgi:hypothetical protein